ncbi:SDR family NAD(P)-dependent oxidoreductase [Rhodothermus profundi]|uniref:NAD(P)-dependent dehydrogenase, short-chain alcohol dehydrogenase family n=1 Tax=Rhodothermus profundi TaxID=633813 RepID=A0A1M6QB32_9BACT|nr:SDR family oxidoreductase [Rhodothermus profundi]SHK17340.1 NAD(P)-dependent dehydrogenase, short-chain alcohol dehydrogenase family [Rhodothermus profundi]
MSEHRNSFTTNLKDKVALITGASRGIGRAIAEAYAAAGARVVLAARKAEALEAVAEVIRKQGGEVLAIPTHVGHPEEVDALVARAVETFGGIDILVNNAATNPHFGPILTAEPSHWDKTFEVNVKGYFYTARACHPHMKRRGGGKIINIASIAGKRPQPGMGVYCVTKAAVLMLTEVLAAELASDNIQVNAIVPGFIRTRFSRVLWETPTLHDTIVQQIPQRRMAEPDELIGLALFLASEASNYMTGTALPIDGGLLIGYSPMKLS